MLATKWWLPLQLLVYFLGVLGSERFQVGLLGTVGLNAQDPEYQACMHCVLQPCLHVCMCCGLRCLTCVHESTNV